MAESSAGQATIPSKRSASADPLQDSKSTVKKSKVSHILPDIPLLYFLATSAHQSALHHYQQAFIPSYIKTTNFNSVKLSNGNPYIADQDAANKSVDLLLLAFDLLYLGLECRDLSDKERSAFATEYAIVGLKLATSGLAKHLVTSRLLQEVQTVIRETIDSCGRSASLKVSLCELRLLEIRVLLLQNRGKEARKQVKASSIESSDPSYHYKLQFILLEFSSLFTPAESLSSIQSLKKYAQSNHHFELWPAILLAQARLLFHLRRWDLLAPALEELDRASTMDIQDLGWRTSLQIHTVLYKILWQARVGNLAETKSLRSRAFALMDEASENNSLQDLSKAGAVISIDVSGRRLYLQSTHPNILYLLTFLIPIMCHRDYTGPASRCKPLTFTELMRHGEDTAYADGPWNAGFSLHQGPDTALRLRQEVFTIRAAVMLEEALALLYRNDLDRLERTIGIIVDDLRKEELLPSLAIPLLLLHAQYAHFLGQDAAAERYYNACKGMLVPGSELGLVVEIGLMGCRGELQKDSASQQTQEKLSDIAARCRHSGANLPAVGLLLASLFLSGSESKKQVGLAWEAAGRVGDVILRALLYAFFAAKDVSGQDERQIRQLEGGRRLVKSFGGNDRDDGVGLATLGLWFEVKLKGMYRINGQHENYEQAVQGVQRHEKIRSEMRERGLRRFKL